MQNSNDPSPAGKSVCPKKLVLNSKVNWFTINASAANSKEACQCYELPELRVWTSDVQNADAEVQDFF